MMDSIQRKDLTTESQNKKSLEIDLLSVSEILQLINKEDESVASKVYDEITSIEQAVDVCIEALKKKHSQQRKKRPD